MRMPRADIDNLLSTCSPVMALVTYILLSGVAAGKAGTFDPRILGQSASRSFGILLLEFVCIRLGCYLLGIGEEGTVVDLVSYEGYKFVGSVGVKKKCALHARARTRERRADSFSVTGAQSHCRARSRSRRRVGLVLLARLHLRRPRQLLFPGASRRPLRA